MGDRRSLGLVGGVALGAGLMYLLDPRLGRRRRAALRDQVGHGVRRERTLLDKARRDLAHRARGAVERIRHAGASDAPDPVIASRIRSRLGRLTTHPRAIEVTVEGGVATLRGAILTREHDGLVEGIEKVVGRGRVLDQLVDHLDALGEPALQGHGRVPRGDRHAWTPAARGLAAAAGGVLAGWGLVRRGLRGKAAIVAGGALVARGLANRRLAGLVGIGAGPGEGVMVRKTITVHAPLEEVFELWQRLDRFPQFMEHVREVRVDAADPTRSYWRVDGPPGAAIRFTAVLTELAPCERIAWETLPDQSIRHRGVIRFESIESDATRVHIEMTYLPPAGLVGHAVARVLGWDPRHRMDDALLRVKGLLEQGHTRAHHHAVRASDVH